MPSNLNLYHAANLQAERKEIYTKIKTYEKQEYERDKNTDYNNCPVCGYKVESSSDHENKRPPSFNVWSSSKYRTLLKKISEKKTAHYEAESQTAVTLLCDEYNVRSGSGDTAEANKIMSNIERLRQYILILLKLETEIISVGKRLVKLYFQRYVANEEVSIINNAPLIESYKYRITNASLLEEVRKKHEESLTHIDECKSQPPAPIEIPEIPVPKRPDLQRVGLFNKKKALVENEALLADYQARMQAYEQANQERTAEIERLSKLRHQEKIRKAQEEAAMIKRELDAIQAAAENFCPAPVVEVCPEKIKLHLITEEVKQAETLLKKLYETRNSLYAYNVIFGKYRNIVALSTFYEYLSSGRCTSLTGAYGAYNLYESESRANLIISKLSDIENSLHKIEKNQYMIYSQLKEMNTTLTKINSTMDAAYSALSKIEANTNDMNDYLAHISANSDVIAHNTAVTAYYSKVNAELTDALGFMVALK